MQVGQAQYDNANHSCKEWDIKEYYNNVFSNFSEESTVQRDIQKKLSKFYLSYLSSPDNYKEIPDSLEELHEIRIIEDTWNQHEEERIRDYSLPSTAPEFIKWYNEIKALHKKEIKYFFDFLADDASLEQIAYYICLEAKVDGRFDDIIALAQLGLDGISKIVMAENYWDEMGHGKLSKMHTVMFGESVNYLRTLIKDPTLLQDEGPVASFKNGNILLMYALRRKYSLRLIGAIAILEHTAPSRFSKTVRGLERFNLPREVIAYHKEHIQIDAKHGMELQEYVIKPLVELNRTDVIHEISKGILIRYKIALTYYEAAYQMIKGI